MAQGEAAGTAAALAARDMCDVGDVPAEAVRAQLREHGAELGETLGEPDLAAIDQVGQLPFEEPPTSGEQDEASRSAMAWIR
jgi:hypothetical protein